MRPRLTMILTTWLVTGTVIGLGTPAWATGSGGAWTDDAGVGARAGDGTSRPGTGGGSGPGRGGAGSRGGGSPSPCTYTALDSRESRIANDMVASGMLTGGSGAGGWYRRICPGSGVVLWVGAAAGAPPVVVDPRALAMEALGRAGIPNPVIGLSPPADQDQIVNLPTWLWVGGWQPVVATAAAGGVTVTVTATPDHVKWAMGNGDHVSCGAGRPYDPSGSSSGQAPSCSYTYRASSARAPGSVFRVSATTTWRIAWAATGISASGDLPAVTRTSSVTVRVAEIQAINQGDERTGGRQ